MAPVNFCNSVLTTKDKIKLRKPAVEKLRRDRINSSIEQLKALLHTELQAHQPSSKLEKADILETVVFYLRNNPAAAVDAGAFGQSYAEGFGQCLEETMRFLSAHNQPSESQQKLVSHFHRRSQHSHVHRFPTPTNRPVASRNNLAPKRSSTGGGRESLWRPW